MSNEEGGATQEACVGALGALERLNRSQGRPAPDAVAVEVFMSQCLQWSQPLVECVTGVEDEAGLEACARAELKAASGPGQEGQVPGSPPAHVTSDSPPGVGGAPGASQPTGTNALKQGRQSPAAAPPRAPPTPKKSRTLRLSDI